MTVINQDVYDQWTLESVENVFEHPASSLLAKKTRVANHVIDYDSDLFLMNMVVQWVHRLQENEVNKSRVPELESMLQLFEQVQNTELEYVTRLEEKHGKDSQRAIRKLASVYNAKIENLEREIRDLIPMFVYNILVHGITFEGASFDDSWTSERNDYFTTILHNPDRLLDYIVDNLVWMEFVQHHVENTPLMFEEDGVVQYAVNMLHHGLYHELDGDTRNTLIYQFVPFFGHWWT